MLVESGGNFDVERVAACAGVSKGLIWRHFGNRSGLLVAIVEDFWDRYDDAIDEPTLLPDAEWPIRERERLRRSIAFLLGEPLAPVVFARLGSDAGVHRINWTRLEELIDRATANIRRGQARAEIPADIDADLSAALVIGGLHQAVISALSSEQRAGSQYLTETLWSSVAAMLRLPHERRPAPPRAGSTRGPGRRRRRAR
jgi:AcrR family transcriptional regulator